MSDLNLGIDKTLVDMSESSPMSPEILQRNVSTEDQQEGLVSKDITYDNYLVKETTMKIKEEVCDEVTVKEEPMNSYCYDVDTTEPVLSNCQLLTTFMIKKESYDDKREVLEEECDISVCSSDFGIQSINPLTMGGADWRQGRIPISNRNIQVGEQKLKSAKSGVSNKSKVVVDTILTPMRFVTVICDQAKLANDRFISLENEVLPNSSNIFKDISDSFENTHSGGLEGTHLLETPILTDQNPFPLHPPAKSNSHKISSRDCPYCPYNSAHGANFQKHLSKHTGEKSYKCILCRYTSSQKFNVKKHVFSHLGYKPYSCAKCTFKACQPSSVLGHLMKKHNFSHSQSLKSVKRDFSSLPEVISSLPEAISSLVDGREYDSLPPSSLIDIFIENKDSSKEYTCVSEREWERKRSHASFDKKKELLTQLRKFKEKKLSLLHFGGTKNPLTQKIGNVKKKRRMYSQPHTQDQSSSLNQPQAINNPNLQPLYPKVLLEVQDNRSDDFPAETSLSTTSPDFLHKKHDLNPKVVLKKINIKGKIYFPRPSEESASKRQFLSSTKLKKNKNKEYSASTMKLQDCSNSSAKSLRNLEFVEGRQDAKISNTNMRVKNQSRFVRNRRRGKVSSRCFRQKRKFVIQKHKCSYCFYSSDYRTSIKRHIKSKHTGEKPFKCSLCSHRTVRKDHLRRHLFSVHFLSCDSDKFISEDFSKNFNKDLEMNESSVPVQVNCPDNDLMASHLKCQLASPPHSPPNSSPDILSSTSLTSPITMLNVPTTLSSTLTTSALTPSSSISSQPPSCISNQHPTFISSSPPASISSQPPILTPPPSNLSSQQSDALSPPPFSASSSPPVSPSPISPPISPVSSPPPSPQRSCSPVALHSEFQIENSNTLCTSDVQKYFTKSDSPSKISHFPSMGKRKQCHSPPPPIHRDRRGKSSNLANSTINECSKAQNSHSAKLSDDVGIANLLSESEQCSVKIEHSLLKSDYAVNSVDVNNFSIQDGVIDKSCLSNSIPSDSQSEAKVNSPFDEQFGPKAPLCVDNSLNPKVVLKKLSVGASLPFTKLESSSTGIIFTLDSQEKDSLETFGNEKKDALSPPLDITVKSNMFTHMNAKSNTFMDNSFANESKECKTLRIQQNGVSQNAGEKCPQCSLLCKYPSVVGRDIKVGHSRKICRKCSYCTCTFSTRRKLLRHIVRDHKNHSSVDISSRNISRITRSTPKSDELNKILCTPSFETKRPPILDENPIQSPLLSSFPENGCDNLVCDIGVSSTDLTKGLEFSKGRDLEEQKWNNAHLPSDTKKGICSCNLTQDFELDPQIKVKKKDSRLKGNKSAESFEVVSISSNALNPKIVLRRLEAKKASRLSMVSGESLQCDPSPPSSHLNFKGITPSESKELKKSNGINFLCSGVSALRVSKHFKSVVSSRVCMKDILKRKKKKLKRDLLLQRNKGKCPYCSFLSVYAVTLSRHISAKHVGMGTRKCLLCPFRSATKLNIKMHLTKVHSLPSFSSRIPVINPSIIIKGSEAFNETCSLNSIKHHDGVEMNTKYSLPSENQKSPCKRVVSHDKTSRLKENSLDPENNSGSPSNGFENRSQNSAESSISSKNVSVPQSPSSRIKVTETVSSPASKKRHCMSSPSPDSCKLPVLCIEKCPSSTDGIKVFESDSAPSLNLSKRKLGASGKHSSFKSSTSSVPTEENYSITLPDNIKIKESYVVLNELDPSLMNKSKQKEELLPCRDFDMVNKKSINLSQTLKLKSDIPDSKSVSSTGSSPKPKKWKWKKRNKLFIRDKRVKKNCPYCKFSSFYFYIANNHIMTNHPSCEPLKCSGCFYTSHFSQVLNRHFYSKHRVKKPSATHTSTNKLVLIDDPKLNQSSKKRREKLSVRYVLPRQKISRLK